jgi:hypothetical protein
MEVSNRLDNEFVTLNGKRESKLEIINRLKENWFKKTFIINYGVIHVPEQTDLPEEFKFHGTITDAKFFKEKKLSGLDYLLFNVLSIGIAIGRQERFLKYKKKKES